MDNYKLTLCYDGSRYSGWQRQGNTDNTIQAKLETLLGRILEQRIELAACGRTDAGVHAHMQVCSFRAITDKSCPEFLELIRRYLPEDIGAVALENAPEHFHARLSCKEKTYLYRIWNSSLPNVFSRRYMLTFPAKLDTDKMNTAAAFLIGRHDFSSFCSNSHMKKSTVRELKSINIRKKGDELDIYITGDGFLYNMVRIIVGTLLQAGTGERSAEDIGAVLNARSRDAAGPTAPAHGLTLWEIKY